MSQILAIDTSTLACSVAVLSDGYIKEDYQEIAQSHTQCLLPMVDRILAEHQLSLSSLDVIALSIGPGSFTGLRIGLGVAQGLAFGADLPIIGLSSLAVLSQGAYRCYELEDSNNVIPCLDARMQEVYWACYDKAGNVLKRDNVSTTKPMLDFADGQTSNIVGVGDGWGCVEKNESSGKKTVRIEASLYPHAYDVAKLAEGELQRGKACSPLEVEPVYIRNTTPWKKRQKIRGS